MFFQFFMTRREGEGEGERERRGGEERRGRRR